MSGSTFPIVDERRFFGFDLFCAWVDVHLMAMMFFLSGLFVAPSLKRKGAGRFAADRLTRLGAPFLFGVVVLTPLAIYPVFHRMQPTASVADYLTAYRDLPFWPNGPLWFLWVLLAFSLFAAAVFSLWPRAFEPLAALAADAGRRPARFLVTLTVAAILAYLPLTLIYGPFDWIETGLFSVQKSRPLLYGVYFFAGAAVGAAGLGGGLLAPDARAGAALAPARGAFATHAVPLDGSHGRHALVPGVCAADDARAFRARLCRRERRWGDAFDGAGDAVLQ